MSLVKEEVKNDMGQLLGNEKMVFVLEKPVKEIVRLGQNTKKVLTIGRAFM
jgi:hypothetical protein